MHGYLAYIVLCAVTRRAFLQFYEKPRAAEVYNLGGGGGSSMSILETIDHLAAMGKMEYGLPQIIDEIVQAKLSAH